MRVVVEQVIQTATKVLDGDLMPREAVTILASMTSEAVAAAGLMKRDEPERAMAYREVLVVVGRELRAREPADPESRHLHAVLDDLAKVVNALA